MSEPTMDEVVGRVQRHADMMESAAQYIAGSELGRNSLAHASDLRALLAAYQSVREDTARLNWLEENHSRISGPVPDSPRFVYWGGVEGEDREGETLREVVDRARTGGTE
jgi:hypothetical protein